MNDDGYTIAEMLAALAILGMAMGGLGLVVSLITRQQLTALRLHDRLADARVADRALETLVASQQAVGGDLGDLRGDGGGLSFACGTATCAAQLSPDGRRTLLLLRDRSGAERRLRLRARALQFRYVGASDVGERWPEAATRDNAAHEQAPRAIILTSDAGVMAVTPVGPREPRDCQYDAIAGACRAALR